MASSSVPQHSAALWAKDEGERKDLTVRAAARMRIRSHMRIRSNRTCVRFASGAPLACHVVAPSCNHFCNRMLQQT